MTSGKTIFGNGDIANLSTLEDIEKKFKELCKEEDELGESLKNLLVQQTHLLNRVSGLQKQQSTLQLIHGDAQQLSSMTKFTATLAEGVSEKVRQLDVAKGRVSECHQRVEDLLDLQVCTKGVDEALRNEDYEQAAAHIHLYLSLDESTLRSTATKIHEGSSLDSAFALLHKAESDLKAIVTQRFDEAVMDEDLASVERFFKIFPLLKEHNNGIRRFLHYLCSKVRETAEANLKEALNTPAGDKRANVIFADTLTLLFEGIARVVEIHQPLVETYYGPGRMLLVCELLQKECDLQAGNIIEEFKRVRQFDSKVRQVSGALRNTGGSRSQLVERSDPRELDLLLGELTLLIARTDLYIRFLKRRVTNDCDVACTDEGSKNEMMDGLQTLVKECNLNRLAQDLLGHYVSLELYFLNESVRKAVTLDTLDETSLSSPMVDDVFFILKKCIKRAMMSSSVDGVCAMLNHTVTVLEEEFHDVLMTQLKQGFPSGYLDLTQAYNVIQTSIQQGKLQTSDTETNKAMFLTYLNNAEVALENISTLHRSLNDDVKKQFSHVSERDAAKLESCVSHLAATQSNYKQLLFYGISQLSSSAIKPRIKPWVDGFISTSHDISEEEFSAYEASDPFIHQFILNIDGLLGSFKQSLTPGIHEMLVTAAIQEVAMQLEKALFKSEFNRLGGLQLDRELRALVSYFTGMTTWSVRERFARLTQCATLLNLDSPWEVGDLNLTWRLTPNEVRHVLQTRVDFRDEDIKKLKL